MLQGRRCTLTFFKWGPKKSIPSRVDPVIRLRFLSEKLCFDCYKDADARRFFSRAAKKSDTIEAGPIFTFALFFWKAPFEFPQGRRCALIFSRAAKIQRPSSQDPFSLLHCFLESSAWVYTRSLMRIELFQEWQKLRDPHW